MCFEFENKFKNNHVSCANEGSAIGVGIGYFLKNKQIPIIYMQNSGLGNAINPLISLAEKEMYIKFLYFNFRMERRNWN